MTLANIESPHNDRRSPGRLRTNPSRAPDLTLLRPSAMLQTGDCTASRTQFEPTGVAEQRPPPSAHPTPGQRTGFNAHSTGP